MIDYLLIGHVSTDLAPQGPKPGGAVTFASRVAHVMGYRTGVLTSAAPDYDLTQAFPEGVDVVSVPSMQTTTFENTYDAEGRRQQTLHGVARTLRAADVPDAWRAARIVHLAPIAEDVDPAIVDVFPNSAIGMTPQGWLRGWDIRGNVFAEPAPHIGGILPRVSAIVVSEEDLVSPQQVTAALAYTPLVVLTRGSRGCLVYSGSEEYEFDAPKVEAVDATGAGDIFATTFFIWLDETNGDVADAARFASIVAAHSVTQSGIDAKMEEVRKAVKRYTSP